MGSGRKFAGSGSVRAGGVRARAGAGQLVRAAGSGFLAGSTYDIHKIFYNYGISKSHFLLKKLLSYFGNGPQQTI